MTLQEGLDAGAKTLVIGVANRGGYISDEWKKVLVEALELGYDIASGLHNLLRDEDEVQRAAKVHGRTLHDVRIPSVAYPIASGVKRTGKRILAVGTDCSVGKMYTGLCMDAEMRKRGMKSTFRPTGQTGILITGGGVPLDAVIADFMAGAVEYLTPDNDDDHWDHIEGQGSLFHASYSGDGPHREPGLQGHRHLRQHPTYGRGRGPRLSGRGRRAHAAAHHRPVPLWCGKAGRRASNAMITVTADTFQLAEVFTISRGSRTEAKVLTARVSRDGNDGWGECVPYARYGETLDSVTEEILSLSSDISRQALQGALPPGAARNAVDCALWDLEAKQAGKRVWDLLGLPAPKPEITAYTLSLDTPENMEASARKHLVRLGVKLVEQPLPAGDDDMLSEIARPLPVCADESCHDRASLPGLKGKYDVINIKLDKTGGLTEALALKDAGLAQGYGVMVGCMVGSSLAMAPATILAQGVAFTDLDGPLLLAEDRKSALTFDAAGVHAPAANLWG